MKGNLRVWLIAIAQVIIQLCVGVALFDDVWWHWLAAGVLSWVLLFAGLFLAIMAMAMEKAR